MENPHAIIRRPLITEKSTAQKEANNKLAFEVDRRANKIEIKKAIEKLFKVKVVSVQVALMQGKERRVGRFSGKRPDWKKAIIKLSPKDKITIFEGA